MKGTLHIEKHDPSKRSMTARGDRQPKYRTLGYWRDYVAKGGKFPQPDGTFVEIPLEEWNQVDPNTPMHIYLEYADPKLIGTVDPQGRPETVE